METIADIQRKLKGAEELKSVVRTMKAMAASNIGQYEQAVSAISDYNRTISLGIIAYFKAGRKQQKPTKTNRKSTCAIVFGSDQGLVGQFNNTLADFVSDYLNKLEGEKTIWAVGERVKLVLLDQGAMVTNLFAVPNSVDGVAPLVSKLLIKSEESMTAQRIDHFYVFHNKPNSSGIGYLPVVKQLLPLDQNWKTDLSKLQWPTKLSPQVAGGEQSTLLALIHEYLFVSLFGASADSLASENASRLVAMQRAEKNIGELMENLNRKFHSIRQALIDEELFDVVSGFEALNDTN
jgi:F-type H+-transporting ATPase subunit gamma